MIRFEAVADGGSGRGELAPKGARVVGQWMKGSLRTQDGWIDGVEINRRTEQTRCGNDAVLS
jgi:hypothetical protein